MWGAQTVDDYFKSKKGEQSCGQKDLKHHVERDGEERSVTQALRFAAGWPIVIRAIVSLSLFWVLFFFLSSKLSINLGRQRKEKGIFFRKLKRIKSQFSVEIVKQKSERKEIFTSNITLVFRRNKSLQQDIKNIFLIRLSKYCDSHSTSIENGNGPIVAY